MRKPEIKNLKKAADRILKAIKSQEKIILFGDADLDGIASVVILRESIKNLGGEVGAIYFPDREKEGYGVSRKALDCLKKYAPALLIAVDCGIGNFEEVKIAKKLKFEIIIIDHHEILDKVPSPAIVVDPKQKGDRYPFKYFAAAGLVFNLAEVLLKKNLTESLRKDFLELAALATISDMMPQEEDNKKIIEKGLASLEKSWRPGIQALLELEPFQELPLFQKVYKINSLLNIKDIESQMPAAFRLLTSSEKKEAEKLANHLLEKNIQKKERIKEISEDLERKIFGKSEEPIIFEGDSQWEISLLGVVASIFAKNFKKPTFLFKKLGEETQGTIRAPSGFELVKAMKGFSKDLITYGGHAQAAGFRIKTDNLNKFKEHLVEYFTK